MRTKVHIIKIVSILGLFTLFFLYDSITFGINNDQLKEDKWGRNPFLSFLPKKVEPKVPEGKSEEKPEEIESSKEEEELFLTGIMEGEHKLAIINDEILGVGDVIFNKRVVKINRDTVVLEEKDEQTILKLEMEETDKKEISKDEKSTEK